MLPDPTIEKQREIIRRVSQGDFLPTIATRVDLIRQSTTDAEVTEQLEEITSELMFVHKVYRLV